ncbi:addiction module protein [candidate division KSB1 bacterium]|nr:addiction module protein [candidate division KSB1 bacterium]
MKSNKKQNIEIPDAHKKILDNRLQEYQLSPGKLLTLDELKERINKRK